MFTLMSCAVFAAGCVHPLGPGYEFADRQAEIRVAGDSPGRIRVRVIDQLQNSGNRPLHSLEVRLPGGAEFGQQNLRLSIDGAEVATEPASQVDARMVRAPFDPVWEQDQKRKVVTEWDLVPGFSPRGTIVASPDGFFIADETAFPLWQTPRGVFARGGTKPDKEIVTIISPPDFRVVAPGKPLKQTSDSKQVTRRYLMETGKDYFPYIVAGRYQEKVVRARDGDVQFWTFHKVSSGALSDSLQVSAERLASSMKSLSDFFGPALTGKLLLRVAESPQELPPEFGIPSNHGAASFPGGVLLDPHTLQAGLTDETAQELAEYEMTRTWFGWRVRPRVDAQVLMGRGVGIFGLVIAAEVRGPQDRNRIVASLIDRYDVARKFAPDKRLMGPPESYSRAERISAGYRAALFFVALEDLCGRDNLRTALRDIIYARASTDVGSEELRAALEEESRKDLAEMFRQWLIQPGIPDDFRNRYKTGASKAAAIEPAGDSFGGLARLSFHARIL